MKKKSIKLPSTAYEIYQIHRNQIHYPLMLSSFLQANDSQFQRNRAVRLLADWLIEYKTMNQVVKHRYANQIPKILKLLQSLYTMEADAYVCLAPFYFQFYPTWKQLTDCINSTLLSGSRYALKFIWYLCFDFCQKIDPVRQYQFNVYLSQNFEQSLLKYESTDQMTFKPLIQTARMINIQKFKVEFVESSQKWAQKMIKIYETCSIPNLKIQLLIQIVGCRSFLIQKPSTSQFWISFVELYFRELEKRFPNIVLNHQADMKLLDSMALIINFEQVKQYLLSDKKRFLKSLISNMKKNPDPKNAFHYQKYHKLRNILIQLFFFRNKQESIKQMQEILTQFNKKYISVLKDNQHNIHFFDCMCEQKISISKTNINEIIKSLANGHSRKMFPVNVLIILVRVLHSASQDQLSEQSINSVIKSLSESIASKVNDVNIFDLRIEISKYYVTLAQKYMWTQQKTTEIMLIWCQQFQRNNKMSTSQTITILRILTKKHSSVVFSSFGHKLQSLISDITYKLKFSKVYSNVPKFVSLLMTLYVNLSWKQSHKYAAQVCSENPQDLTFVYLLQSQIITQEQNTKEQQQNSEQKQFNQLKYIIQTKQLWKKSSNANVYLYYIELFLCKIQKKRVIEILFRLDDTILKLFEQMNQDILYHLMIHLAVRLFFKVGDITILRKLKSYHYFKSISFDILSRSFHKQSVLLMTYMYCKLMINADNLETFFMELNEERFLNSLFQGCDDFIGKSNRFYQEICYIILLAIKAKQNYKICGFSNLLTLKEMQKNIVWWQEANYRVSFKLPEEQQEGGESLLIQEFKQYYQEYNRNYFKDQINNMITNRNKPYKKEDADDDGQDL